MLELNQKTGKKIARNFSLYDSLWSAMQKNYARNIEIKLF